jgi:hypothetical protein
MAFAESAYTYEENTEPVVYEVGIINYSKSTIPSVSSGKCLDFFHFFLRPEYAMDYGFWHFQGVDNKGNVDKTEIVLSKRFNDMRKVNHSDVYYSDDADDRNRSEVKLVKTDNGYISKQIIMNDEKDRQNNKVIADVVDQIGEQLRHEIATSIISPQETQITADLKEVFPIVSESKTEAESRTEAESKTGVESKTDVGFIYSI